MLDGKYVICEGLKKFSACTFPSFESYISAMKYVIVSALAKRKSPTFWSYKIYRIESWHLIYFSLGTDVQGQLNEFYKVAKEKLLAVKKDVETSKKEYETHHH